MKVDNFITAKLRAQVCGCKILTAEQGASLSLGRIFSICRMFPIQLQTRYSGWASA